MGSYRIKSRVPAGFERGRPTLSKSVSCCCLSFSWYTAPTNNNASCSDRLARAWGVSTGKKMKSGIKINPRKSPQKFLHRREHDRAIIRRRHWTPAQIPPSAQCVPFRKQFRRLERNIQLKPAKAPGQKSPGSASTHWSIPGHGGRFCTSPSRESDNPDGRWVLHLWAQVRKPGKKAGHQKRLEACRWIHEALPDVLPGSNDGPLQRDVDLFHKEND